MSQLDRAPSTATDFSNKADLEKHEPGLAHISEDELEGATMDDAAHTLAGQNIAFSPEEERRLRRKLDWRLMVIMGGLQFVDKAALGNAATFGLRTDLGLAANDFSWAVSIFYFGYLLGLPISLYMMQRWHIGRWIAINTVLWGISILGTTFVTNFAQLAAMRFLLGLFEACVNPGFTMLVTAFYRQSEQPWRFGLFTLLNGWLPIPAIVIFWAIGNTTGTALAPWRYIFVLLGSITIVSGFACWVLLPDNPSTCHWLSERERVIAVGRVAQSQTGIKNHTFKREQMIEALTDVRAWLVVLTLFLSQSGGAVTTNFLGIIISGFNFPQLRSLLLQTPAFAIQGVICLIVTGTVTFWRPARKFKQPVLSLAACCVIAGTSVIYSTTPTAANRNLLLGMLYLIAMNNCSFTTILSVIGINFAGNTKKSTIQGMVYVAYNIVVPQAFLGREAPRYRTGILTVMSFQIALVLTYWTSWALMMRENRRRDQLQSQSADDSIEKVTLDGLRDMTDRSNLRFRYLP